MYDSFMIGFCKIRQLLPRAVKFGVTGVTSTVIYVGMSYTMINTLKFEVIVSVVIAFISASIFSYITNTIWSFSQKPNVKNIIKFALVTSLGSCVSATFMKYTIASGLGYWAGIIVTLSVVPPITFIVHQVWTYRPVSQQTG